MDVAETLQELRDSAYQHRQTAVDAGKDRDYFSGVNTGINTIEVRLSTHRPDLVDPDLFPSFHLTDDSDAEFPVCRELDNLLNDLERQKQARVAQEYRAGVRQAMEMVVTRMAAAAEREE